MTFQGEIMAHHSTKRSAIAVVATMALTACGGGSGGGLGGSNTTAPPAGSYDLHTAMAGLVKSGLSVEVNLSGTAIANGTSNSFTGTGTLTLSTDANGTFNGTTAEMQTETISGTVTVAGQSAPYTSTVVNAYDSTAAFLGESSSSEFDVASAPITIPSTVGTSATELGTLSRYTDSTRSVVLGTTQVSVVLSLAAATTGAAEVVQFTYKVYDSQQTLVETDTFSYNLSESSALTLNSATVQNASGSLTATPQ
jgi:hypothetical protein